VRLVSPLRLRDGEVVSFGAPDVVAFFLIEAKKARDKGERRRKAALRSRTDNTDGSVHLGNEAAVLDALAALTTAVLSSFSAVEALANTCIDDLPDNALLALEKNGVVTDVDKDAMVRSLRISEKLDRAVPLLTGAPSIKGTKAWERYVHLRRMRDNLVHVKQRGYSKDPDEPTVFGMLLRGDASDCVEDAVAVVDALRPDWLTEGAREKLA
jgi:hypothetical protein